MLVLSRVQYRRRTSALVESSDPASPVPDTPGETLPSTLLTTDIEQGDGDVADSDLGEPVTLFPDSAGDVLSPPDSPLSAVPAEPDPEDDCALLPDSISAAAALAPRPRSSAGRPRKPYHEQTNERRPLAELSRALTDIAGVQAPGGSEQDAALLINRWADTPLGRKLLPARHLARVESQIAQNVRHLLRPGVMPKTSPMRRALLNQLTRGIREKDARDYLAVSLSAIFRARRLPDDRNLLLTLKSDPTRTPNQQLPEPVIEEIKKFWLEACPPHSHRTLKKRRFGSEVVPVHIQVQTDSDIYANYCRRAGDHAVCKDVFIKHRPKQIKPARWEWCVCEQCTDGRDNRDNLEAMLALIHGNCPRT